MPERSTYYDREATAYDASRGGAERARAADTLHADPAQMAAFTMLTRRRR